MGPSTTWLLLTVSLQLLLVLTMTCGEPLLVTTKVGMGETTRNDALDLGSANRGQPDNAAEGEVMVSDDGFLDLKISPQPLIQVHLHSDLVLKCQASGSPCPKIRWIVDGAGAEGSSNFDVDDNDIVQTRSSLSGSMKKGGIEMAIITSTLQLPCIRPEQEAQYSCIIQSGSMTLRRTTRVVIREDDDPYPIQLSPQCEIKLSNYFEQSGQGTWDIPAQVMTSESLHMAPMGSDTLLPCRAVGQPKPEIYWVDGKGQEVVTKSSTKFQVLSNGDLMIRDLEWTDMGEFVCFATNKFGTHSGDPTFVYPLASTSDEEKGS